MRKLDETEDAAQPLFDVAAHSVHLLEGAIGAEALVSICLRYLATAHQNFE